MKISSSKSVNYPNKFKNVSESFLTWSPGIFNAKMF